MTAVVVVSFGASPSISGHIVANVTAPNAGGLKTWPAPLRALEARLRDTLTPVDYEAAVALLTELGAPATTESAP